MSKVNKDDIGAVCSRIDAQTRIMIEVLVDCFFSDEVEDKIFYYTWRYDKLTKRFRKKIIGKVKK